MNDAHGPCPAVQISDAVDKGKNQLAALGAATPLLADAMALSMPCREMCEAVMASCSCGMENTFGELLQSVIDDSNQVSCLDTVTRTLCTPHCNAAMVAARVTCWVPSSLYQQLVTTWSSPAAEQPGAAVSAQRSSQRIPPNLSKLIFGDLLQQPLCSLFARSSTPGFSGHCDLLPAQCSDEKAWCQAGNPGPALVQQLIAGQIAKVSTAIIAASQQYSGLRCSSC